MPVRSRKPAKAKQTPKVSKKAEAPSSEATWFQRHGSKALIAVYVLVYGFLWFFFADRVVAWFQEVAFVEIPKILDEDFGRIQPTEQDQDLAKLEEHVQAQLDAMGPSLAEMEVAPEHLEI